MAASPRGSTPSASRARSSLRWTRQPPRSERGRCCMADDIYEVFAITYARHDRNAAANFIGGDPHDGPMPLNYYVWVIRNAARTIVVDTGFDRRGAEKRGRELLRPLPEALEALGIDRASVANVVITHMHYDHCGNDGLFPNARFHLQDAEIAFATGR